ncbi:MAG: hypothetical protein ACPGU1_21470 [Myxococcota bacterium]
MRSPSHRTLTLVALTIAATLLSAPDSEARRGRTAPLVDPTTTQVGELAEGIPKAWAAPCDQDARRPVSLVMGFDQHREYGDARPYEAKQARGLLSQLCPGDRVQLVEVGRSPRRLGDVMTLTNLSDIDDLVLRIEERRARVTWKRMNAGLLQAAVAEWGQPVNTDREELLRVLVFFTRDLESRAGKDADMPDFSWSNPPYWLRGHALVSVFRPIVSDTKVETWEVFVATTPGKLERGTMAEGLRVEMEGWLAPVRRIATPEAPKVAQDTPATAPKRAAATAVVAPTTQTASSAHEGVMSWDQAWTPWAIAGLLFVMLLLGTFWVLFRAAPKRLAEDGHSKTPKLILVLRDRLHNRILSEDKMDLKSAVRVGASLSNDLMVAGPYGLEILPSPAGSLPRIRATNSLPIEVHRAAGGRLVRATDSAPVPLRGGDRINLGAGQELEVRFAS